MPSGDEPPEIPHHDRSRSTYPPILLLESVLGVGIVAGVLGAVLFAITVQLPDFGGENHWRIQMLSGLVAFLGPLGACASKVSIDWLIAAGFFVDLGDGIERNAKFITLEKPIPVRMERLILLPAEMKALLRERDGARRVAEANLKIGDSVTCFAPMLPVWYGGHIGTHHGGDGVFFGLLACWGEKDGVVVKGDRPPPGHLQGRPGRLGRNGRKWDLEYWPWDVPWKWVPEKRAPSDEVLREGHWTAPLPTNVLEYLGTNEFAVAAGGTMGHTRKARWWGGVPKLYRTGFVKVGYQEIPAEERDRLRVHAEAEKDLLWSLQGTRNLLVRENTENMAMFAQVGVAGRIGHSSVYGRTEDAQPFGVGPQGQQ